MAVALFVLLAAARNLGFWRYSLEKLPLFASRSLPGIAAHSLLPLLGTALLAFTAWGLGLRLLRRLSPETDFLHDAYAFASGLGVLAFAAFLTGLLGLLNGAVSAVLAAGAAALGWPAAWKRFARVSGPAAFPEKLAAGLLAYAAWHALVTALAPPTEWDVLVYHLALPKLYWKAGAIMEIPWLLQSHWPHLMEALYAALLAARADAVPALLHAAACAVLVAAVYRAAVEEGLGRTAAWAAAVLAAAQPVMLRFAGTAHSDGAEALFYFLSAAAVWSWSKDGGLLRLALGGALGGLAVSTKIVAAIPVATIALWMIWRLRKEGSSRRFLPVLVYLGPAALLVAPWLLKTWVGAGNPLWPFFSGIFGGRWGAAQLEGPFLRNGRWPWPVDLELALRYGPQYLLLPCAVLAAAGRAAGIALPGFLRFLWLACLPNLVVAARTTECWRYMLPHFPVIALTAGYYASRLAERGRLGRGLAVLALACGAWPLLQASQNNQLFAVLEAPSVSRPGAEPRRLYLERSLDHHGFYQRVDALLSPAAKVLLFREIRGYYLDARYQWGDPINQGLLRYESLGGPEELLAALRGQGITHVLVNEGLGMYAPKEGYYDPRTVLLMDETLKRRARRVLSEGPLSLYALKD